MWYGWQSLLLIASKNFKCFEVCFPPNYLLESGLFAENVIFSCCVGLQVWHLEAFWK